MSFRIAKLVEATIAMVRPRGIFQLVTNDSDTSYLHPISENQVSPESMNSPGIIRPKSRISIPELGLKQLATRVVEAASVLSTVPGLTAHFFFGACSVCGNLRRRVVQLCQ